MEDKSIKTNNDLTQYKWHKQLKTEESLSASVLDGSFFDIPK